MNLALGLPEDMRDYRVAAEMLHELGVRRARLLINNPAKLEDLERHGVEIAERVPLRTLPNPSNVAYLRTKREKMGHLLADTGEGEDRDYEDGGGHALTASRPQKSLHACDVLRDG